MEFSLTFQDESPFSVDHTSFMGTTTEETSQSDNQNLTLYDPTMRRDNESLPLNSLSFNEPLSPMFFEPSSQAITGDIPARQPTPSPAHIPSNTMPSISTDVPVVTTVAPALATSSPAPATNATTQGRFGCPLCPRTFDRLARAEACHNKHHDLKPHLCQGACGDAACNAAYSCIENLHRHLRVPAKRKEVCPYCSRSILKQNISRHKKYCM